MAIIKQDSKIVKDNQLVQIENVVDSQAKADAAEANAKSYTDQEIDAVNDDLQDLTNEFVAHKADDTIHKTSDVIRTETNTQLKVEVVSSSVSETPDTGRIIFDTSQGKFFGGNGSEWV